MSLRRFLNLVTLNRERCVFSLRRMDMSGQHLFYAATPAEPKKLNLQEMESIQIPPASISFHPNPPSAADNRWKMHWFGLSENKIICTDQSGLSSLYDAGFNSILIMPGLHSPKGCPISFSVPDPDEQDGGGGRLYIIEQSLKPPHPNRPQFEAFVYAKPNVLCFEKIWCRHSLPLPPFILEPGFKNTWICSHAVLGGGSHLCMSFKDVGTYCFDTAKGEWSHAGDWMLPLYGNAEYLPELNLWFGIGKDLLPGVSDLSSVLAGEKPELCGISGNNYRPPDWEHLGLLPHIISLGSGRLCILDFFQIMPKDTYLQGGHQAVVGEELAVFTGVELLACGNVVDGSRSSGKGNNVLRMINHKSGIYRSDVTATIETVL